MLQPIALKSHITRLKALLDKSKTTLYLAACLSVFSCQENSLVIPEPAQGKLNQARVASSATLKKYRLIKWGDETLTYYPDGRIKRALDGPSGNYYRQNYTYTGSILASSGMVEVVSSGPVPKPTDRRETYWYDNAGHCYKYKRVIDEGSGVMHTYNNIMAYNAKGQMTDFLFSSGGLAHYDYNADGDLVKVTFLNAQMVPTETHTLSYTPINGGPAVNDLYPLHPAEWAGPFERYLPYFGPPNKHLVQSVVVKRLNNPNSPTNVYYSYVLNADGYVTLRKAYHKLGGAPIEITPYEYEVTLVNIPN